MNQPKPSLIRFSLRTLLVLMMLVCIALATTVSASPRVEYAMKWVSALAPAVAILLAAATSGLKRAFWIGFAAFGIWGYPQLCMDSHVGNSVQRVIAPAFDNLLKERLSELHQAEVEAEQLRRLRASFRYIFAQNPGITRDEILFRFPREFASCLSGGRNYVTGISYSIAWQNLYLGIAVLGGIAAAAIHGWRLRHTSAIQESAGTSPAAH